MEITKIENESECFDISFSSNDRKFLMCFGGDGDLYWSCIDLGKETNDVVRFPITKENYMLYSLIEDLYERFKNF